MKEKLPEKLLADSDPFAKREQRRRKHGPKPNIATWIVIAWLAFMAAWGGKHLYRLWTENAPAGNEITAPAWLPHNASGQRGVGSEVDLPSACPLK